MAGLMQWRSALSSDRTKILWVQEPGQPWRPYTACKMQIQDYSPLKGVEHSKGWAALQHYKRLGYTLIASDPSENDLEDAAYQSQQPKLMPLSGLSNNSLRLRLSLVCRYRNDRDKP